MLRIFRCVLAVMFVFSTSAFAQETRGTINGHVLDEQGGAMPGVTVTITNVDTNVAATLTTNSTGYYQAPLLLPGNYRVSAELQGFKTSVRSGIILSVAQQATVDLTLGVGALSETVTVSGEAPILETGVLTTGQNLDRRSVESLPMFSNMPVLLTRFVTGVNSSAAVPVCRAGFRQPHVERHVGAGRSGRERMDDRRRNQQRQRSSPGLVAELRHDRGSAHRDGELRRVVRPRDRSRHLDDDAQWHQPDARDVELSGPGTTSGTRRGISRSGTTTPTSSRRARAVTRRWPSRSRRRTSILTANRTTWRARLAVRSSGTSSSRS